ncbi:MAG: hypothetical protein ACRD2P_06625 [Terriglobia bacterium]
MEKKWGRAGIAGEKFLCVATFLPVRRWRYIAPFLWLSFRIETHLKQSPGLVRYGLKTDIPRKHFWTLSMWNDRMDVEGFVASEPHRTAVKHFEKWAGPGAAFVEWESSRSEPFWAEALERLKSPTFYYHPVGGR